MKSYTDIPQSEVLTKILPPETADMCYKCLGEDPYDIVMRPYTDWKEEYKGLLIRKDVEVIPCWSLAALLTTFPYYEINNNGVNIQLSVKGESLITEKGECLLDLVVNMVIYLHELKML